MIVTGSAAPLSSPSKSADPLVVEGLRFAVEATPLGVVAGAGTARGLQSLVLLDTDADAQVWGERLGALPALAGHPLIGWVGDVAWSISVGHDLNDLTDERVRAIPLDLVGTPFQHAVWTRLRALDAGQTTTYSALAAELGRGKGSSQAVAGACAANPVAIVVPCHRVVGAGGEMRGYRWGVERKRALLAREQPPELDLFGDR
jgi:AraC family transcriptional regulator of adaptative response/methylated-DNA-[protein]-cysteine methyltransferase